MGKNNKLKVGIVTILAISVASILLQQLISRSLSEPSTYTVLEYSPNAVTEICSVLDLETDMSFCTENRSLNEITFLALLEEKFPYGSEYSELTLQIDEWSIGAGGCNGEIIYGSCPSPATCIGDATYLCTYDISFTEQSIQLNVRINRHSGTIVDYSILERADS